MCFTDEEHDGPDGDGRVAGAGRVVRVLPGGQQGAGGLALPLLHVLQLALPGGTLCITSTPTSCTLS